LKKQDNNNYSKKEALAALTRICSKKETCTSEAIEKLTDWGISNSDANEILEYLIKEKYIDNLRYATHFASDKFRFNKWGRYKILNSLKQKHISGQFISAALENISKDDYLLLLKEELMKKFRSLPKSSDYEIKGKLYRFAASRGFENDLIMDLLNEIIKIK
jgi:regulatory protein